MRRRSWPSGGGGLGGLTMSEDGGLDEVEESLRAAASCRLSSATTSLRAASSPSSASTRACNRPQLGQSVVSSVLMAGHHTDPASGRLQRGTATLYLDSSGRARERDAADPAPGYEGFLTGGFQPSGTLGFWAPGYTPRPFRD